MDNLARKVLISLAIVLITAGCSNLDNPVQSKLSIVDDRQENPAPGVPAGAVFVSADLVLDVYIKSQYEVTLHRITADWSESEVNWDNFAGAYDTVVSASFLPDQNGPVAVDISSLVGGWLDGSLENHGLLLRQSTRSSQFHSSETSEVTSRPGLIVRFEENGQLDSIVIRRGLNGGVADAFIAENIPIANYGDFTRVYVGMVSIFENQALFKFPLQIQEGEVEQPAGVGDRVFNDLNRNGIQDVNEPGVAEVAVNLYGERNLLIANTVTDDRGLYKFDELDPGDYSLKFVLPDGYSFSPRNSGNDPEYDSDAEPNDGTTARFTLQSGQVDLSRDAGIFLTDNDDAGCTHGIGYWKRQTGQRRRQVDQVSTYLPIYLGHPQGFKTLIVDDAKEAFDVLSLRVYGRPGNGITMLYAQLLTAKLNIADGADDSEIVDAVEQADSFLDRHGYTDWRRPSRDVRKEVRILSRKLASYNNGKIGPGSCDNPFEDRRNDDRDDDAGDADDISL
jgi:hypothetical protein